MKINEYLWDLWLNDKEITIFLNLYKLWINPASILAKHINMERTYVYKTLLKLTKQNLVFETSKWGIKHFYIPDSDVIKKFVTKKIEKYQDLKEGFSNIETELKQYKQVENNSSIPKITFFDSIDWIENLYNDIYENVEKNKYISIKLFSTNTFESQTSLDNSIKNKQADLFSKLSKNNTTIETYLWNGISTMEEIVKTTNIENLYNLPASNSAINIFVVWKITYIIIYKKNPFWIKMDSEDLSNAMHFIFEKLDVE